MKKVMKTQKQKHAPSLLRIYTEFFVYNNTIRLCITKKYSDDTIIKEEKFADELKKIILHLSDMTCKSSCIEIYNFKEHDYYK